MIPIDIELAARLEDLEERLQKLEEALRDAAVRVVLQAAQEESDVFAATDALTFEVDSRLRAGDVEFVGRLLEAADCSRLRPSVIGGLIVAAAPFRKALEKHVKKFVPSARQALIETWGLSASDVEQALIPLA